MSAQTITPTQNDMKRRRQVITPEGVSIPITVASRGARLGAFILDITFFIAVLFVFHLLMVALFSSTLAEEAIEDISVPNAAAEFVVILYVLFMFVARYGYFLGFELGPRGATWGKRLVGIRVAARDGGRLSAEAIIARNLIRDIEVLLPLSFFITALVGDGGNAGWAGAIWVAIFIAFPFFNKDAMRAGDVIAGTWVVEVPKIKLAETLSTQGAAQGTSGVTGAKYEFGEAELSIYGEHELQTLERVLRDDKDEALIAVHGAICNKIGWSPGAGDERAFLEAFYAQLRARLESDMRFGKRKADKFAGTQ
ncbi:MAG: RDD family protein [Erythrobacter sp.]